MLKKIIFTLIALFLLASAALAYFILTFDADHYRPLIETKATELTGFPVKLGDVSLTWKNGVALEVRELVLKVRESDEGPAPVSIQRAYVALELMPLLKGTLQMGSIIVENPEVRVTRSPDGRLHGAAELAEAQPGQQAQNPSSAESTLALLIQNIRLSDGKFVFEDQYGGRVRIYTIDQIELGLKDVSLLRPFPVELKAAMLSDRQNIQLAGKVHIRLAQQEVKLIGFGLTTDLEDLDFSKLTQAIPELGESGLKQLGGRIQVQLEDLVLSEKSKPGVNALVELSRGRAVVDGVEPIENIALEAQVSDTEAVLKSLSADWSGSRLASSAKGDWRSAPEIQGSFQAVLSGLDLAKVVPPAPNPRDPGIQGVLSARMSGSFAGADELTLTRGLKADGEVSVKKCVITNLNVLKEVLSKLSIIPGVSQKIQERLSDEYLAKLEERDTRLEDLNIPLRVADGFLFADSIVVQSETFRISGRAQAALQGPLTGRLYAAVDPEFSLALMRGVRELEYIADQNGQITIPLTLRGTLQTPEVIPEVQQLASQLAMAKTQEVISGLLTKKKSSEAPADSGEDVSQGASSVASTGSQASTQQTAQPADPFAALLGQVLQAAVKKNE